MNHQLMWLVNKGVGEFLIPVCTTGLKESIHNKKFCEIRDFKKKFSSVLLLIFENASDFFIILLFSRKTADWCFVISRFFDGKLH